jgi:hypothetical protein
VLCVIFDCFQVAFRETNSIVHRPRFLALEALTVFIMHVRLRLGAGKWDAAEDAISRNREHTQLSPQAQVFRLFVSDDNLASLCSIIGSFIVQRYVSEHANTMLSSCHGLALPVSISLMISKTSPTFTYITLKMFLLDDILFILITLSNPQTL